MPSRSVGETASEILQRDAALQRHFAALGMASVDEYQRWCAERGLSARLKKNWRDRSHERWVAIRSQMERRIVSAKAERRQPHRILDHVLAGELTGPELQNPDFRLLSKIVGSINDNAIKQALGRILSHVHGRAKLVTCRVALGRFGERAGNTYLDGLWGLACNHAHWLRPVESWQPLTHNVARQFSSLAAHLLLRFPVPRFLDSVWFRGHSLEAAQQQAWYRTLGSGKSARLLDTPIRISRLMAGHFLQAPQEMLVEEALRRAQVLSLGGDSTLARAILSSRLGTRFEHDDFWMPVIRWCAQNLSQHCEQVGPLIDYIHHQRFEPQEDGTPAAGGFDLKGRSAMWLIGQMRAWHARLRHQPQRPNVQWQPSGIGPLDWTEGVLAAGTLRRWTIVELLSSHELVREGQVLRHCVASYATSCRKEGVSIWSLGVERNHQTRKPVLTIQVNRGTGTICQVRGKANRLPNYAEMEIVRRWAVQERLVVPERIRG